MFGVDIEKHIPKVEFDFTDEMKQIKEIRRLQKEIAEEAAGMGVGRGPAGIRGGGLVGRAPAGAGAAPGSDIAAQFQKQLASELTIPADIIGQSVFGPAQIAAKMAREQEAARAADIGALTGELPNVSGREAQFQATFRFENAPPGMSIVEERSTKTASVDVEGLGPNP
jgi:hypothetical protein